MDGGARIDDDDDNKTVRVSNPQKPAFNKRENPNNRQQRHLCIKARCKIKKDNNNAMTGYF